MQKGNQDDYREVKHPFEKVFTQIEDILKTLEANKDKPLTNLPSWIIDELNRIDGQLQRLQQSAERTFPVVGEYTEEELHRALAAIPEELRTPELEVIEKAEELRKKTVEAHRSHPHTTDINLLKRKEKVNKGPTLMDLAHEKKEKNLSSEIAQRKKFGRMGSKKNWRPM